MRQNRLSLKAPAKINLFLRVIGRRSDGYHLLETCMHKVSLYDEIELVSCAEGIHLHCFGGGGIPVNRDNLVCRAAELFFEATQERRCCTDSGVTIGLTKRIPVAAGLGGGSSDAAATLRGLNELFECGCSTDELIKLGLRLGADVPFFLADASAAFATGIGEILQPVAPLHGYSVLMVNPGFPVSTRWVYQSFALTKNENASKLESLKEGAANGCALGFPVQAGSPQMVLLNDLEMVTIAKYPELARLKDELLHNGASAALMSGSGPTVFGLFAEERCAEACYALLKRCYPYTYLVAPVGEK